MEGLASSAAGGAIIGLVFFGGLYWTLASLPRRRNPAPWALLSLVVRLAVAAGGFFFIGAGDWRRLLAGLAGFLAVRIVLTLWLGKRVVEPEREERT